MVYLFWGARKVGLIDWWHLALDGLQSQQPAILTLKAQSPGDGWSPAVGIVLTYADGVLRGEPLRWRRRRNENDEDEDEDEDGWWGQHDNMTISCSCFSEWMTGTLFQQQRLLLFLPQLTLACPFFGEVGSQGHQGERCGSQPTRSPPLKGF
jgi:hypothetical protein